jgi:hypothetical protein
MLDRGYASDLRRLESLALFENRTVGLDKRLPQHSAVTQKSFAEAFFG